MGCLLIPQWLLYIVICSILVVTLVVFVVATCITGFRYSRILGCSFLFFLFTMGWQQTWQPHPTINKTHFSRDQAHALIGYVEDEPTLRGNNLRFPLKVTQRYTANEWVDCSGILMLTVQIDDHLEIPPFSYGDRLMIPAQYREVDPPYNPGEMNYKRYLAGKNMWHQAYVQAREAHQIGAGMGNPIVARALALRQQMIDKFSHYLTDYTAFSVASTLILGYRTALSQEVLNSFSVTGTIHVLSVSGMHVVIVFWLLSQLLRWMNYGYYRRIARFTILVIAIWGYALLTGFSPSVLRASLMMTFFMAASSFGRQQQVYNSIAASAFFLLWHDPKFIVDIGFQLSYLAVLGMVFLLPKLQALTNVRNRYVKPVSDYALMSVAAQTGAGPLAAYYFHQFPIYFLPANLLIVLPASAVMYLGFALLLLPYGELASGVGYVLENLILLTHGGLSWIEQWPMASVVGIRMAWWENLLIYMLVIAMGLAFFQQRKQLVYGILGCVAILVASSFLKETAKINQQKAIFFNIRNNMAIGLIERRRAWIYSDLPDASDNTIRYAVMPVLETSVPADNIHFVSQGDTYEDPWVFTKENIVQFGQLRLMVYEADTSYRGHLDVDILLLRNNPRVTLDDLQKTFTFRLLILDASNYDATISRFEAEAVAAGIPIYVLKRNFAYVWDIEDQLP